MKEVKNGVEFWNLIEKTARRVEGWPEWKTGVQPRVRRQFLMMEPMFRFRVLIDFEIRGDVFVARCLETGSVATAADAETAEDMMVELLVDAITFAVDHNNLAKSLCSSPMPLEVWFRFRDQHDEGPIKIVRRTIPAANTEGLVVEIEFVG